jgi:hypothetical protein
LIVGQSIQEEAVPRKIQLSRYVDWIINWLKWPAGVAAVVLLPRCLSAMLWLGREVLARPYPLFPLLGGLVLYTFLWLRFFRRPMFGSFLSTVEHELTHGLFAILTFHRVTDFRATWRSGGHIRYTGPGNWLITIAPYFFPTICLLLLAISALVPAALLGPASFLMGVAISYHLTSTYVETHSGQSDLKRVGGWFALLFLPFANLVTYGMLISFCHGGLAALKAYLTLVCFG